MRSSRKNGAEAMCWGNRRSFSKLQRGVSTLYYREGGVLTPVIQRSVRRKGSGVNLTCVRTQPIHYTGNEPMAPVPGVDVRIICVLAHTSKDSVPNIIKNESDEYEITKSIINILYNLRIVGSIPINKSQKRYLESEEKTVRFLLNTKNSLAKLQARLIANPKLVILISGAGCANLNSSYSHLTDIGNSA